MLYDVQLKYRYRPVSVVSVNRCLYRIDQLRCKIGSHASVHFVFVWAWHGTIALSTESVVDQNHNYVIETVWQLGENSAASLHTSLGIACRGNRCGGCQNGGKSDPIALGFECGGGAGTTCSLWSATKWMQRVHTHLVTILDVFLRCAANSEEPYYCLIQDMH